MTQTVAVNKIIPIDNYASVPEYFGAITKVFKSEIGLKEIYKQYQFELKQWPVTYEESTLLSPFGQTYCLTCGKEENPPLVLLHGLGVNAMSFHCNIETLSQHYRVYLLDFPGGAGRSIPSKLMLKKRNVAAWLNDSIKQIEQRKVTVLGVSFGAWLAAEFALTQPTQLERIIFTSPPPLAGKAKLGFKVLLKMIILGLNKNRENMKKLCQLLAAPNFEPDERTVTAIYNGLNYTKSFKESGHGMKKRTANSIKVPIHFIIGKHEILCDEKSLPGHFPDAKVSIVENSGHMLNIERSDAFNLAVINAMS
jgi:pimeloyl-ACP methyl ester carboxylesterase